MASLEVLVYYDPSLPLKLDCNESAYGVGAVLLHTFPNGDERPVAYASRTLTQTERGYAQIQKEALSLIFWVKKFHQYLYGRKFFLVTDHKPLLTILGPKKELPTLAAARFQRWAVLLSAYQHDIEYRSTDRHSNTDGFSRLPMLPSQTKQDVAPSSVFNLTQIARLPIDANGLQKATREYALLSRVVNYVCAERLAIKHRLRTEAILEQKNGALTQSRMSALEHASRGTESLPASCTRRTPCRPSRNCENEVTCSHSCVVVWNQ